MTKTFIVSYPVRGEQVVIVKDVKNKAEARRAVERWCAGVVDEDRVEGVHFEVSRNGKPTKIEEDKGE